MAIKPYLQLVRLPNVFTAAADSLAGWLLVGGSLANGGGWVPLALASMAIYAAGIALNDVFDYAIDLRERPARPLPSGKISRRFAAWLGGGLLAAGPLLAALSDANVSALVAGLLAGCVLAYDGGGKRTILGPFLMGACRGLNLLLGASQAPALGGPPCWLAAGAMALFVAGITWISRGETESGRSRGLYAGLALEGVALLALVATATQARSFPSVPASLHVEGLVALAAAGALIAHAGVFAVRDPSPARFQRAVKTGVLSLVWLNFGVVAAVRGIVPALAIAALWVPAFVLGRWLYST